MMEGEMASAGKGLETNSPAERANIQGRAIFGPAFFIGIQET
jgi:hypothetical protein